VEEAVPTQVDYRTHILIGATSSGSMSVICRWPYVPRQTEVKERIDKVQEGYAVFLLCTPTSIMPVANNGFVAAKRRCPGRFGR
jgi:hypothetical protein